MPASTSKKRRRGTGGSQTQVIRPAQQPPVQRAVVAPRSRRSRRTGLLARWERFAQSDSLVAQAIAPDSPLWVVLLLTLPVIAVGLNLTAGLRLNALPYVDLDYWWHIATGEWILDHHRIPTTDPFSWTYGGGEWIAHEWLAEVVLALTVRAGGYAGAVIFTTIVCVLGFWRLLAAARFYGMSRRMAAILMMAISPAFMRLSVLVVRPQVWTWALLGVLFAELAVYDVGRRKQLWLLPPLFAVWVNLNLTALIGMGCLGAFVLDRLIRRPDGKFDRHVLTVGGLSGLALLVNPYHVKLPLLVFEYLDPNALRRDYILEWMPPARNDDSHLPYWIGLVLLIPAVWYLARRRPHLWPGAPLIVLAYSSYRSMRYIPIFLMLAIVFIGWLYWQRGRERGVEPASAATPLFPVRPWVLAPPLLAAALTLVLARQVDQTQLRREPVAFGHPVGATDWYLANYSGTRLFNTYDFGGYLIYRFAGTDNTVYIDGREEMYGKDRVNEYFYYIYANQGWQQYFDERGIDAVMIRRIDGNLSAALSQDPGWTLAYSDEAHLLFVRVTPLWIDPN